MIVQAVRLLVGFRLGHSYSVELFGGQWLSACLQGHFGKGHTHIGSVEHELMRSGSTKPSVAQAANTRLRSLEGRVHAMLGGRIYTTLSLRFSHFK